METPEDYFPGSSSQKKPPIFKAWILFVLASNVIGFFVGFFVGAVLGAVLVTQGLTIEQIQFYCGIAGFITGLPISYIFFKWSVETYLLPDID